MKKLKKENKLYERRQEARPLCEGRAGDIERFIRRRKRSIGFLAIGSIPYNTHDKLISALSSHVHSISDRDALMVIGKYGDADAAGIAIAKLDFESVKKIAGLPNPRDRWPGAEAAVSRLAGEGRDDFEAQCILATIENKPETLERIRELAPETDPGKALLSLGKHYAFFELHGEDIITRAVERVSARILTSDTPQMTELLEVLCEMAIVGLARDSLINRLSIKALSGTLHLVEDQKAAMVVAICAEDNNVREAALRKLDHLHLAHAYRMGVDEAAEFLKTDFENVQCENALKCVAFRFPELRARAVGRLDVNALGPLLRYEEAIVKVLANLDKIGPGFGPDDGFTEVGNEERFILRAASKLDEIQNPHVLQMIYRNHPDIGVSSKALRKIEEIIATVDDDSIRRDILRISRNNEARVASVRGLSDVGELKYQLRESGNREIHEAAVARFGELLAGDDLEEPLLAIGAVISHSQNIGDIILALRRMTRILSGEEGGYLSHMGELCYYDEITPETALEVMSVRVEDIIGALEKVRRHDCVEGNVLTYRIHSLLTEALEEFPEMERNMGIRLLKSHLDLNSPALN